MKLRVITATLLVMLGGATLMAPGSARAQTLHGADAWLASEPLAAPASPRTDPSPGSEASPPPAKGHWSSLPFFGAEAAARGFTLPLPFGIGGTYYREKQPFDITDLKVSLRGSDLVSVTNFAQIGGVEVTQRVATARFDVWLFPFLNVYGILGYMNGKMTGTVSLPEIPIRPPTIVVPAQTAPLSIAYEGPMFGAGMTLAGGFEVAEWRKLTAFVVLDANYTYTDLDFVDDDLEAGSAAQALVISPRLGLRAQVSGSVFASGWVGGMYQRVSETLEGKAPTRQLEFVVTQKPTTPWNVLVGGRIELGRHVDLMVEAGLGTRQSILGGLTFRF